MRCISFFTATTPDVAFHSSPPYKDPSNQISAPVFAAGGGVEATDQMRETGRELKRPSALHRFIATGSCTAQEKCAYIITCGPGILQRALLIAETQSGGGERPAQEKLGEALPRN